MVRRVDLEVGDIVVMRLVGKEVMRTMCRGCRGRKAS